MGQMIKFEHGMLVLNSLMTKEDVAAINEFADYVRNQENERIIKLLEHKADEAMRAGQGKPMPERMEYLAVETSIRQVIALIKGKI